jgi:hypothetical protein
MLSPLLCRVELSLTPIRSKLSWLEKADDLYLSPPKFLIPDRWIGQSKPIGKENITWIF